ncbi:hypothetical protein BACIT_2109 [Bacillus amyloliquefaciens]|nr:hypothetical protein BACIT_2109 [Bacillus amyloliquefaciens]
MAFPKINPLIIKTAIVPSDSVNGPKKIKQTRYFNIIKENLKKIRTDISI